MAIPELVAPTMSRSHDALHPILQVPAKNTLCEVDADYEIFSGVTTADILAHLPSVDV